MDLLARILFNDAYEDVGVQGGRAHRRAPPTAAADLAADYRTPQVGVETRFAVPGFAATEKVYRGGG